MISWRPFCHNNKTYELTHLNPFKLTVTQAKSKKNPEINYTFNVEFSIHCFTTKTLRNKNDSRALEYSDARETRYFCFNRYELSKQLPAIIKDIGPRNCYHTGYSNYFIIELLDKDGKNPRQYEIYFQISKSGKKKGMNLYVESAYIRDKENNNKVKKKKPIRFYIIAYNKKHNKPIKAPK